MDGSFFSEDDLAGLFSELDEQAIEEEIDQMRPMPLIRDLKKLSKNIDQNS